MKLKKLRKQSEKLAYRVCILEQQQRLAELRTEQDDNTVGFHKRGDKTKGAN